MMKKHCTDTTDSLLASAIPEPNTGCYLWTGCLTKGCASVGLRGRKMYVSRIMLELKRGFPLGPLFALHKCDTPACVNPDHLFAGTLVDNSRDMKNKGRSCAGLKNARAKINQTIAAELRSLRGSAPAHALAARFGVSVPTVRRVFKGAWS